jgi:hypothetical protein
VSCPDWGRLAALRDRDPAAEPAGWREAVEHSDACPPCRRRALAADPTLLFRRLPVHELTAAEERAEVEATRRAVAAMRTAGRMARGAGEAEAGIHWRRWAAAAVLAVAALSARGPAPEAPLGLPAARSTGPARPSSQRTPATIEGLSRPGARIYHYHTADEDLVMIVDESFAI